MVLTPELHKMLVYIKDHPGIFYGDLNIFGEGYSEKIDFLISHNYVEHIVKSGKKMNFFKISLEGEIYLQTQAINQQQKRYETIFKLLDLIVPALTGLLGVWLGYMLGNQPPC